MSGSLTSTAANARSAAAAARRERAEWLVAVAEGAVEPMDVVRRAALPEGRPLRRIRLAELLGTAPTASPAKTRRAVDGLCHQLAVAGSEVPEQRRLTVGWLLDARSDGRRLTAFAHALHPREEPWPGFPYTPQEPRGTRVEAFPSFEELL